MLHILMQLLDSIKSEFRRRVVEESFTRIRKCLHMLSDEEIWNRLGGETVSIGNIVLHLNGNITQYILTGLQGNEDNRKRSAEFTEEGPVEKTMLIAMIDNLEQRILPVIEAQSEEDLLRVRDVQGFQESGLSIIVHVIEHTSYHTGQIAYMTKVMSNKDLGFYEGFDLG